jgi:hypothetical protein
MKGAFVLRLSRESEPEKRQFVGWIEEVDTAREQRFQSTDELLSFLSACLTEDRQHESQRRRPEEQS